MDVVQKNRKKLSKVLSTKLSIDDYNSFQMLPVNGMPKLVIANEEAVAAAAWPSPPLLPLIL
jgi:hypothetical protein